MHNHEERTHSIRHVRTCLVEGPASRLGKDDRTQIAQLRCRMTIGHWAKKSRCSAARESDVCRHASTSAPVHGTLGQTRHGTVLRGGEASVPSCRSLAVQVRVIQRRRASHPPEDRADPCSPEVQLRSREGVPANRPLRRTELVNQRLVRAPGGWAGREASPPDRGDYAPLFCRRPL